MMVPTEAKQVYPTSMGEVSHLRYNDLLGQAQKQRLLKEARADRPSPYASFLSRVGSMLITVGRKLEAHNPSSINWQAR